MCETELTCLQMINENLLDIKAFCYALAVALVLLVFIYTIQKVLIYTIGQSI